MELRLGEPLWLLFSPLVLLPWLAQWLGPRLAWPSLEPFAKAPRGWAGWPRFFPPALRAAAIACLIIALARPQTIAGTVRLRARGVAIVLALDISSSMKTTDFPTSTGTTTRLDAAKQTFNRFVDQRPDDLIGLVAFANYPDTACPPTLDHRFLSDSARALPPAPPQDDGTNLGDALVWALRDARDASPRKKVIILLTDGRNEPGVPNPTDPIEAARIAGALRVVVHVIAIGKPKVVEPIDASTTTTQEVPDGPALALLGEMAHLGGGRLFQAADDQSLGQVFDAINRLERSAIQASAWTRFREWFPVCLLTALGLLGVERLARWGRLKWFP